MEPIEEFHNDFMQEVYAKADADSDFIESEFINSVTEHLIDSGEIEGFDYCPYKAVRGMRVDGYDFVEDEGLLNLFVSEFYNKKELASLTRTAIVAALKRLENFFVQCLKPDFYPELEETSPGYGLAQDIFSRKNKFSKVKMFLISDAKWKIFQEDSGRHQKKVLSEKQSGFMKGLVVNTWMLKVC